MGYAASLDERVTTSPARPICQRVELAVATRTGVVVGQCSRLFGSDGSLDLFPAHLAFFLNGGFTDPTNLARDNQEVTTLPQETLDLKLSLMIVTWTNIHVHADGTNHKIDGNHAVPCLVE